jgi:hypothetical protein
MIGGSGPRRLPCHGCAWNAGGGMAGRTGAAPLGCCPPLLPLGCPGMYQGVLLFQPAGNATDASGLLCTVCSNGSKHFCKGQGSASDQPYHERMARASIASLAR